jgi:tetratricopeptide (TPR) repeat protein/predicted Ser/Thr protein kinase
MIGQQFGHYEVVGTLGSGGMGVVYLARDLRLDRHVAIKVLSDRRVGDEGSRARFRREAQALSRLNHPNIATVYDFDSQDERDFLVMEYIDGQSLRDATVDPLPREDLIEVGVQLAEALVAAHGAGVVHLDLKPGNLMRTRDGRLKVLDFGIARLHAMEASEQTTQTSPSAADTGTVANSSGTPPYMAPEQVAAGSVDGRTDIYGAGATLYELATGRRLFTEPRGPALYDAILRRAPEPPSRLNPAIDATLEAALLKAVAKHPSSRQQTAQELLEDLQRSLTTTATSARRGWTRREVLLTAGASVVAVAATGYTLWPVGARARLRARDFVVVGDFQNRTGDALLGGTVKEALTMSLQQSAFVNVVSRERVADTLQRMQRPVTSAIDEAVGLDICRREGVAALISGDVTESGGTTRITVKVIDAASGSPIVVEHAEYREPGQLFARVDDLAARVRAGFGEADAVIASSTQPLQKVTTGSPEALRQYSKAVDARAMGEFNAVEGPLLAALQLDPDFAMAHLKLGDYYMDVAGDDQRALVRIDTAYRLRTRVTDRERHFIAAQYFSAHQQFDEARESLQALTAAHPDDPDLHYELAIALYALEQMPAAVNELRQAIRFNPHGARAHGSLVLFLARANRPDAALDALADARRAGVASPYLHWAAGLARLAKSDVAGARSDFTTLANAGGYFAHLGQLQQARALLFEDRIDDAIAQLREFIDVARREGDVNLEVVARLQCGRACAVQGDRAAARQHAVAVVALTSTPGSRPIQLRDAGRLALAAGDRALAEQQFRRLRQLETAGGTRLVLAARLFLEGAILFHDRRFSVSASRLAESYALRPWYECRRFTAEACEAQGQWAAAAEAWQGVLNARGQIVQDGFTPDLRLADTGRARAVARAGKD